MLFLTGEESAKDSVPPNEGTENIPPKTSQSTTKKRGKLFHKPSAVAALLSPAKTVSFLLFYSTVYLREARLFESS